MVCKSAVLSQKIASRFIKIFSHIKERTDEVEEIISGPLVAIHTYQ